MILYAGNMQFPWQKAMQICIIQQKSDVSQLTFEVCALVP